MSVPVFIERLKAEMDRRGISPYDLASQSGVTAQAIYRFLAGNREPQLSTALKLAAGLHMTVSELAGEASSVRSSALDRYINTQLTSSGIDDPIGLLEDLTQLSREDRAAIVQLLTSLAATARAQKAYVLGAQPQPASVAEEIEAYGFNLPHRESFEAAIAAEVLSEDLAADLTSAGLAQADLSRLKKVWPKASIKQRENLLIDAFGLAQAGQNSFQPRSSAPTRPKENDV